MFNKSKLLSALREYKKALVSGWWGDEQFKWRAIKCFRDNWNIDAPDFAEMLDRALGKTSNLLASANNFPLRMILKFAEAVLEDVRAMFAALFDESSDVVQRIENFKLQSTILLEKHGNGAAQHYQYENAISVYLWLRYPDKYYIYKFSEVRAVAGALGADYVFKKGAYEDNLRNFLDFYDEICDVLKADPELTDILKSKLTPDCYPDPELKTLTADFGFFISRNFAAHIPDDDSEWYGLDYDPGLTVEDWGRLLRDPAVFTRNALEIMKRLKDFGGEATCTQLAQKYGENKNFYNSGSVGLARRVCDAAGIEPNTREDGSTRWWTVPYVGRSADEDEAGSFVWKLRDELSTALDGVDLSGVRLYAERNVRYWIYSPGENAQLWENCLSDGVMSVGWNELGDLDQYESKNELAEKMKSEYSADTDYTVSSSALWNFSHEASIGDVVYARKGVKAIIGRGVVESDYEYDAAREGHRHFHRVKWEKFERAFQTARTTFYEITKPEIINMIENGTAAEEADIADEPEPYTKADFLSEVYMSGEDYGDLVELIARKKNIILQGAPGVGKTYAAKRLAWSIMGEKDDSRIQLVQFHQNYSYEDFVMGYKPRENGFRLEPGVFYEFCKVAENRRAAGDKFFFIIDEINRGNMSKIFGELLMLIENGHRGDRLRLAYKDEKFSVPDNLYIIGMMNTADRSLAMIDYALRRRFSFFEMKPAFESEGFKKHQAEQHSETLDKLIDVIKDLNKAIAEDTTLGKGFCIGHSYFCDKSGCTDDALRMTVEYDIIPTLEEYWFDSPETLKEWAKKLRVWKND